MGVTESTAILKCCGHYKHFFKGVYYRAVKVSSRLEVGMQVLSTFEVFIDSRNLEGKKKSVWKLWFHQALNSKCKKERR